MRDAHPQGAGRRLLSAGVAADRLERESLSPEDTRARAEELGRLLEPGDVVLLEGELGAGKTVFVQGLARGLGVDATVKSPTFTLLHQYRAARVPLTHLDLYRVPASRDLTELALDEVREASVLAVEWGGRLETEFPDHVRVDLAGPLPGGAVDRRALVYTGRGARGRALIARLAAAGATATRNAG